MDLIEGLQKIGGALHRRDLGLDDDFVAREFGEDAAELHFGRAARGFDVVDAEFDGAVDAGFEIFLVFGGDVLGVNVLPFELVTHPAAGDDRHGKFRASESSIFHAARLYGRKSGDPQRWKKMREFAIARRLNPLLNLFDSRVNTKAKTLSRDP